MYTKVYTSDFTLYIVSFSTIQKDGYSWIRKNLPFYAKEYVDSQKSLFLGLYFGPFYFSTLNQK